MRYLWGTMLVLSLGYGDPALSVAQTPATRGMVIDTDQGSRILVLETRLGRRELRIASNAVIRDHHGRSLMLHDVRPGDAVAYRVGPDGFTELSVARQFWATPLDD